MTSTEVSHTSEDQQQSIASSSDTGVYLVSTIVLLFVLPCTIVLLFVLPSCCN